METNPFLGFILGGLCPVVILLAAIEAIVIVKLLVSW